jgi:signal transduction histidine kinase
LVDNAIKYTPEGSVNITVTDSPIGKLEVKISDTGIGISENYKPYIFSPFSQEDKGTTRKYQGNGIGLALVRKFVELNSASIYMESKKGQGTSFIIVFN